MSQSSQSGVRFEGAPRLFLDLARTLNEDRLREAANRQCKEASRWLSSTNQSTATRRLLGWFRPAKPAASAPTGRPGDEQLTDPAGPVANPDYGKRPAGSSQPISVSLSLPRHGAHVPITQRAVAGLDPMNQGGER